MAHFPETKLTLIRRLADQSQDSDWRLFLDDYWNPIYRFAARRGHLQINDAEEVASLTILAICEGKLLARWVEAPQSKLRTLICGIARNVLSNRARIQSGRERILREQRDLLVELGTIHHEQSQDIDHQESQFYAAWVEELLQSCLKSLQAEMLKTGRDDYFRVLYGRVCDQMSNPQIADCLNLKVTDVENYYKRVKNQLQSQLREMLIRRVSRYCLPGESEEEFKREWNQLGEHLKSCGGIEAALRNSYDFSAELSRIEVSSKTSLLKQLHAK